MRHTASVSGSSPYSFSRSTKLNPCTGSPPMPTQELCPSPAVVSWCTAHRSASRNARQSDTAVAVDIPGHDADLAFAGADDAGTVGPTSNVPVLSEERFCPDHIQNRDVLGNDHHKPDARCGGSQAASAADAAGTKTTLTSAPVARTACSTESNTGTPRTVCPPRPALHRRRHGYRTESSVPYGNALPVR